MSKTFAKSFDWNVICMVCRKKIKASEAIKRWDNLIVGKYHPGCYEVRHPLDYPVPPVKENKPLSFVSPEGPDEETTGYCTVEGSSSISDHAVADCMISDRDLTTVGAELLTQGSFNTNTL